MKELTKKELTDCINKFCDSYWGAYENEMPVWTSDDDRDKTMLYHFHKYVSGYSKEKR